MRIARVVFASALSVITAVRAFHQNPVLIARRPTLTRIHHHQTTQDDGGNADSAVLLATPSASSSRKDFLKTFSIVTTTAAGVFWQYKEPAFARGRATLEKSFERYAPRITAGGAFYGSDLRKMVEKSDWAAIKNALQEPPQRTKEDLTKPDSGVAARARQAGQFSDARVLVAMDLLAGAFSDNSVSAKTKKMQESVQKLRESVEGMQLTARQALGEVNSGGFFGLGSKKPSEAELVKALRQYYVAGGNAYNEYIYATNDELALKFDRLPFIKA